MESKSIGLKWAKFFLFKDKLGKTLLAITLAVIVVWLFTARDSLTFGLLSGCFLIAVLIFSFLNYITLGRYRENAEKRFYDAIYLDCGFLPPYKGRTMKNIQVYWKGLRVSKVSVNASSNSQAAKSPNIWRSIKLSVSDSFKLTGSNLVAILDEQSSGRIEFITYKESSGRIESIAGTDEQINLVTEYDSALFMEELHAFTYETLSSYGTPLPRLHGTILKESGKTSPRLQQVEVKTSVTSSSYERRAFETSFRQRYNSSENSWNFTWNSLGVIIESIDRGSQKEKIIQATNSLTDLISSSISNAFRIYDNEAYIFSPDQVKWSNDRSKALAIDINFLQSNISQQDRIIRFEELMSQGLSHLYRGVSYEYAWEFNAFEKTLTINAIH